MDVRRLGRRAHLRAQREWTGRGSDQHRNRRGARGVVRSWAGDIRVDGGVERLAVSSTLAGCVMCQKNGDRIRVPDEILIRQVNPAWLDDGEPSSQSFYPWRDI